MNNISLKLIRKYDAWLGMPRPLGRESLAAEQAVSHLFTTVFRFLLFILGGLAVPYLLPRLTPAEGVYLDTYILLMSGQVVILAALWAGAWRTLDPYRREIPPPRSAPVLWADPKQLRATELAQDITNDRLAGELRLGTLTTGEHLVLPKNRTMRHIALFGPKASGKSGSFICTFLRDWAKTGSAIVLDSTDELFEQTASKYRRAYRLDLIDPSRSDYWNFVPDCKENPHLSYQAASVIVDAQSAEGGVRPEPPWRGIAIDTLRAVLLHLPQIIEQPTLAMIGDFLSIRSIDPENGEIESPLTKEMNSSPDPQAAQYWKAFADTKRDLQGVILSHIITRCRSITSGSAQAVTSSFGAPGSAKRYAIDLRELLKPGTDIYVRVSERHSAFLNAFLRLALSVLSGAPPFAAENAPVLLIIDEPVSTPIQGLDKILIDALFSEVAVVAAFRSVSQVSELYGPQKAYAILSSFKNMVFLPGLDRRSIECATGLAFHATMLHRAIHQPGKATGAVEQAEAELPDKYVEELTKLQRHWHAIALLSMTPPIRFLHPSFYQLDASHRSKAANKGTPYSVDFRTIMR